MSPILLLRLRSLHVEFKIVTKTFYASNGKRTVILSIFTGKQFSARWNKPFHVRRRHDRDFWSYDRP